MKNGKSICDLLGELAYVRQQQQLANVSELVARGILPPIDKEDEAKQKSVDRDELCACLQTAIAAELKAWWNGTLMRPSRMRGLTALKTYRFVADVSPIQFLAADPTRRMFALGNPPNGGSWIWPAQELNPGNEGISIVGDKQNIFTEEDWGASITYPWFLWGPGGPGSIWGIMEECYVASNVRLQ